MTSSSTLTFTATPALQRGTNGTLATSHVEAKKQYRKLAQTATTAFDAESPIQIRYAKHAWFSEARLSERTAFKVWYAVLRRLHRNYATKGGLRCLPLD